MEGIVKYEGWNRFRKEYKTFFIGHKLPYNNGLNDAFYWDSTPQKSKYWSLLCLGEDVFSISHYNNLADIYGDPPYEENLDIEECM